MTSRQAHHQKEAALRLLLIVLEGLDGKGDLVVLRIEINDLSGNLIANLQNIRRLLDVLLGDLGNMKQSVNAGLQLNECAEISHACYLTGNDLAYCILLVSTDPRILIRELQRQGDLVAVDVLNKNTKLLANLEDLLRALNTAPAHLGDVKQTICSAKIYESTEISDVLNGSFYYIANLKVLEQLRSCLFSLCSEKLLAIADVTTSSRIVLGDHELDLLSEILGKILLISVADKGSRNEYTDAFYNNTDTTGEYLRNLGLQDGLVLICLFDYLIAAIQSQSLVRESYGTLAVVYLQNLDIKLVAYGKLGGQIQRVVIGILLTGQDSIALIADIQDCFFRLDINDGTFDHLSIMNCLK